jgi:hypothetical protein
VLILSSCSIQRNPVSTTNGPGQSPFDALIGLRVSLVGLHTNHHLDKADSIRLSRREGVRIERTRWPCGSDLVTGTIRLPVFVGEIEGNDVIGEYPGYAYSWAIVYPEEVSIIIKPVGNILIDRICLAVAVQVHPHPQTILAAVIGIYSLDIQCWAGVQPCMLDIRGDDFHDSPQVLLGGCYVELDFARRVLELIGHVHRSHEEHGKEQNDHELHKGETLFVFHL